MCRHGPSSTVAPDGGVAVSLKVLHPLRVRANRAYGHSSPGPEGNDGYAADNARSSPSRLQHHEAEPERERRTETSPNEREHGAIEKPKTGRDEISDFWHIGTNAAEVGDVPVTTSGRTRTGSARSARSLLWLLPAEPEQVLRDLAHLDLLRALRDSVAAVMAIDVLERHVA